MQLYSHTSLYALRALSYLIQNQSDERVRAKDIAEAEDIPLPFLTKILFQLSRKKIIHSSKGRGGGVELLAGFESIPLIEIVRIFEEIDDDLDQCAIGWAECSDHNPCALHHEYREIKKRIRDYLNHVTLITFAGAKAGKSKKSKRSS